MENNLPETDIVLGGKYAGSPIAHYPNWAFMCPNCTTGNSYYELPQELPDIQEAYKSGMLKFSRPCGCVTNDIHPETLRLWQVM